MTIEDKKKLIRNTVPLGIDFFKACMLAECSDEETDLLHNDTVFQHELEIREVMEEKRLLRIHRDAAIRAAETKNNTMGLQWKLERLNKKWSKNDKQDDGEERPPMTIKIVNYTKDEIKASSDVEVGGDA